MALVVKAHYPWRMRIIYALIVAALAVAGYALFDYGRFSAKYDSVESNNEIKVLMTHVDDLEDQIQSLREQKAVLERDAQIERKAYDELDTTLKVLQAEILELKEELAFYRGIVSPKTAEHGLFLQRFKVEPNGQTAGYRYKIILTQVLKEDRIARGIVSLSVAGLQGKEPKVLSLNQISEKSVRELEYKFKYFQNLEGDIKLPPGFTPQRVVISVTPRNAPDHEPIQKTFDWPR